MQSQKNIKLTGIEDELLAWNRAVRVRVSSGLDVSGSAATVARLLVKKGICQLALGFFALEFCAWSKVEESSDPELAEEIADSRPHA